MFHVCIAHCMPEKIHKISKSDNSCLFVWSTVYLSIDYRDYVTGIGNGSRAPLHAQYVLARAIIVVALQVSELAFQGCLDRLIER